MLWLVVDLTTVILCVGVSLFFIFVSCNVSGIVMLESLPTPRSIHASLLLERLSIGCLLISVLYLRVFNSNLEIHIVDFLHADPESPQAFNL